MSLRLLQHALAGRRFIYVNGCATRGIELRLALPGPRRWPQLLQRRAPIPAEARVLRLPPGSRGRSPPAARAQPGQPYHPTTSSTRPLTQRSQPQPPVSPQDLKGTYFCLPPIETCHRPHRPMGEQLRLRGTSGPARGSRSLRKDSPTQITHSTKVTYATSVANRITVN